MRLIIRFAIQNAKEAAIKSSSAALTVRARAEITSHFGASAGRADARRRDELDVRHRRGAATKPIRALCRRALCRRAPSGCGAQFPLALLLAPHIRPGYSSSLAPRQRA